ncbi:hypothetical protein D3C80_1922570 [compost metagenome]
MQEIIQLVAGVGVGTCHLVKAELSQLLDGECLADKMFFRGTVVHSGPSFRPVDIL